MRLIADAMMLAASIDLPEDFLKVPFRFHDTISLKAFFRLPA
jgi:hypothetical protein